MLRALEAWRGQRTEGPLILRPPTHNAIDRRDAYRMITRIAKLAAIPRHISPHSLRHAAITNALDAGVPLRDAQILARHADPRTTEHYDRAPGNLDRHAVHFTAYVAGVSIALPISARVVDHGKHLANPRDSESYMSRGSSNRGTCSHCKDH
ncbi:tyrosine-type recombinase/integrase [Microlunatus elymi]|uniref:tyrosine-type recombinase/integrase n=1 Tax=Microlunatus elymi TaxID=2596828 RepID=UPI001AEF778B